MNLFDKFKDGLQYDKFIERYATDAHRSRWQQFHEQVSLSDEQRSLLGSFTRSMPVLVLAGTWCGDCINQCPIFEHFRSAAPVIETRYIDRDDHADAQRELTVNGGNRVPVVVFFSEDGYEVARFGDRTLSKYRQMMREQAGPSCPTGLAMSDDPLLAQVTQDWLREFERAQWILRLSPRLRQKHGD